MNSSCEVVDPAGRGVVDVACGGIASGKPEGMSSRCTLEAAVGPLGTEGQQRVDHGP